MNTEFTPRGRTVVSGLLAAAITTVLVSSLVESFDPVQLLRIDAETAPAQIAEVRKEDPHVREA